MRGKKVPANPIPEQKYQRFKYKLEELSIEYPERNLMLFYLGVATGYRIQDIIDLTIGEIKEALEDEEFIIQEKKQYRQYLKIIANNPMSKKKPPEKRNHPIKPKLKKLLKEYIKGKDKSDYAFASKKNNKENEHIEEKSFSNILSKVGKALDLKNISGHSLRKTYVHRLWQEKHDLEYIRKAIGHKNIETTKKYLGIDDGIKDDAAEITDDKL